MIKFNFMKIGKLYSFNFFFLFIESRHQLHRLLSCHEVERWYSEGLYSVRGFIEFYGSLYILNYGCIFCVTIIILCNEFSEKCWYLNI